MIRKVGVITAVVILGCAVAGWVASGDARRALDRANLLTHHRHDCVFAEEDWMLGEYRTCGLVLTTGHLLCKRKPEWERKFPNDFEPKGDCRTLDVAYHGNLETALPSLPMDWDCQLKAGSGGSTSYLDCRVPK